MDSLPHLYTCCTVLLTSGEYFKLWNLLCGANHTFFNMSLGNVASAWTILFLDNVTLLLLIQELLKFLCVSHRCTGASICPASEVQ